MELDGVFINFLNWFVAFKRDAVHDATKAVVVVDWVVLGAAVVPKGNRIRLPGPAAGQLGPDLMRE